MLVPGIVQNLTCQVVSSTEIALRWEQPKQPNGNIEVYLVSRDADEEDKSVTSPPFEMQFDNLGKSKGRFLY